MRYKYRYPERELDLIVHCKSCKNTKSFLGFHMDDYESLICLNCNKKYPSIFLPYVNHSHENHENWAYPLEQFKKSKVLADIEDLCLFEEIPLYQDNLLLEYLDPKPCIKCGVVDDNVWLYHEDNSAINEDSFYSMIKSKENIKVDIALRATCVPCGHNFDPDDESIDEDLNYQEWQRSTLLPMSNEEQENLALQAAMDMPDDFENPNIISYEESYSSVDQDEHYEQNLDDVESDEFEDSMGDHLEGRED